jgi:hypothetical protein
MRRARARTSPHPFGNASAMERVPIVQCNETGREPLQPFPGSEQNLSRLGMLQPRLYGLSSAHTRPAPCLRDGTVTLG